MLVVLGCLGARYRMEPRANALHTLVFIQSSHVPSRLHHPLLPSTIMSVGVAATGFQVCINTFNRETMKVCAIDIR